MLAAPILGKNWTSQRQVRRRLGSFCAICIVSLQLTRRPLKKNAVKRIEHLPTIFRESTSIRIWLQQTCVAEPPFFEDVFYHHACRILLHLGWSFQTSWIIFVRPFWSRKNYPKKKLNMSPKRLNHFKRKIIFQPAFFRWCLLVFGGVNIAMDSYLQHMFRLAILLTSPKLRWSASKMSGWLPARSRQFGAHSNTKGEWCLKTPNTSHFLEGFCGVKVLQVQNMYIYIYIYIKKQIQETQKSHQKLEN